MKHTFDWFSMKRVMWVVSMICAVPSPASADPVLWTSVVGDHRFQSFVNGSLDQSNTGFLNTGGPGAPGSFVDASQSAAQTFTVGANGLLTRIDLGLYKQAGATGDVTFDLLQAAAFPRFDLSAASIFHTIIPISSIPLLTTSLLSVDVSAGNVSVKSGDEFAIALTRSVPLGQPDVVWQDSGFADSYSRGSFYEQHPSDGAPAPEPASTVLITTGLGMLAFRRCYSRKGAS